MINKEISLYFLFLSLQLSTLVCIISNITWFSMILTFMYVDPEFNNELINGFIDFSDTEFNIFFKNHFEQAISLVNKGSTDEIIIELYNSLFVENLLYVFSIVLLYSVYKIIANKPIEYKLNSKSLNFYYTVIENINNVNIKTIRVSMKTLAYGRILYLTMTDFVRVKSNKISKELEFKVFHEVFHMKTYDIYWLQLSNIVSHINSIILSYSIAIILAGVVKYYTNNYYMYLFALLFFNYVMFKLYMFPLKIINRNKEFMADLYASKKTQADFELIVKNKNKTHHPNPKKRKEFIKDSINNELLYIAPVVLFFWFFFNVGFIYIENKHNSYVYLINTISMFSLLLFLFIYRFRFNVLFIACFLSLFLLSILLFPLIGYYMENTTNLNYSPDIYSIVSLLVYMFFLVFFLLRKKREV